MKSGSWQLLDPRVPNRKIIRLLAREIGRLWGAAEDRLERAPGWGRLEPGQVAKILAPEPAPARAETAPAGARRGRARRHIDRALWRRHRGHSPVLAAQPRFAGRGLAGDRMPTPADPAAAAFESGADPLPCRG